MIVDLLAFRRRKAEESQPQPYDGITCPECGNAWFETQVCVAKDNTITGHARPLTCIECGEEIP